MSEKPDFIFAVRRRNLTDTLSGVPDATEGPWPFLLALFLILGALAFLGLEPELRARVTGAIARGVSVPVLALLAVIGGVVFYRWHRGRQAQAAQDEMTIAGGTDAGE